MALILAIDLGTHTGFAFCTATHPQNKVIGSWAFKNSRSGGTGSRFLRLRKQLGKLHGDLRIGRVFFKEGSRSGNLTAALTAFCKGRGIPCESVPSGAVKTYWTGEGNASNELMIEAALGNGYEVDDNSKAHAIAILEWAIANRVTPERVAA